MMLLLETLSQDINIHLYNIKTFSIIVNCHNMTFYHLAFKRDLVYHNIITWNYVARLQEKLLNMC